MRLLILLLSCLPLLASANPCRVGEFTRLEGRVLLERAGRAFPPFTGLQLCRGDRIITSPAAVAELRLRDGSRITVGKDSVFSIADYRLYRDRPNSALFDLARGAFRAVTAAITTRPHRFEVRTPVATIGVRGTDFWGGYGLTPDGLDVIMLEGKGVYVQTAAGTVELDRAGLGTTVTAGTASAPAAWAPDKLARAVATITP
jgi:hypothetical protein